MDNNEFPDFERSIFVCSKPLQFFNCASIVRQYKITKPIMYVVVKNFSEIENFKSYVFQSIYNELFCDIVFLNTHEEVAYTISGGLEYDSLFIECDRLANYQIYSSLKTKYLCVFEEGVGTYVGGPDGRFLFLKWLKWKMYNLVTGSGMCFGSGKKTDHVLVSNVELYKRLNTAAAKKALGFPGVIDEVQHESTLKYLSNIQSEMFDKCSKVAVILGTWGGAEGINNDLLSKYDLVIYKSHPHDNSPLKLTNVITVSPVWLPAEVIIGQIASYVDAVDIYHYSSSAVFYSDDLKNVRSIDLLSNKRYVRAVSN